MLWGCRTEVFRPRVGGVATSPPSAALSMTIESGGFREGDRGDESAATLLKQYVLSFLDGVK